MLPRPHPPVPIGSCGLLQFPDLQSLHTVLLHDTTRMWGWEGMNTPVPMTPRAAALLTVLLQQGGSILTFFPLPRNKTVSDWVQHLKAQRKCRELLHVQNWMKVELAASPLPGPSCGWCQAGSESSPRRWPEPSGSSVAGWRGTDPPVPPRRPQSYPPPGLRKERMRLFHRWQKKQRMKASCRRPYRRRRPAFGDWEQLPGVGETPRLLSAASPPSIATLLRKRAEVMSGTFRDPHVLLDTLVYSRLQQTIVLSVD